MGSRVAAFLVAVVLLLVLPAPGATLSGRVVDESGAPVTGARITLTRNGQTLHTESGAAGNFHLAGVEGEVYELRVEKSGFYVLIQRQFRPPADSSHVDLVLNHQQEYEERVDVVYSAPAIDPQQVPSAAQLSAAEVVDLPYPSSHEFRNGLAALPGVVQDNRGKIHLGGGTEDQVLYTLNGFTLTDPYTGTLEQRIPVDAIRQVQVQNSRYAAEFGKSSAGTLSVESGAGDDRFRYTATNFIPSGQLSGGLLLSKWTPRGSVSGPWRRGRAWFFEALDAQYNLDQVEELPRGANRNARWAANNLFRNDFLLGRSTLLNSTLLVNDGQQEHLGLGPRDPLETTTRFRQRHYFLSLKGQQYREPGVLLELGLAASRLGARADPLGAATYRISPDGQSGNYFEASRSASRRWQVTGNVILPGRALHGRHEWKMGADLTWIGMERRLERRPFEVLRSDGTLWRRTVFTGPSAYRRGNFEQSAYLQDRWLLSERVALELGLRQDWNEAVSRTAWSPRLALAAGLSRHGHTKLTTGWGLFHDTVPLEVLTRGLDQARDEYVFAEGGALLPELVPTRFLLPAGGLKLPRTSNFSLGVEQRLPAGFYLRAGYIARRTADAFAFLDAPARGIYLLGNRRHDRYDALELRAERGLGKGYRWMGAYTRSSARSDAVLSLALTNPVFGRLGQGPLDWDTPHRLVSSAWLPVRGKYGIAYLLEWRSGYPFSVFSEKSGLVGPPNNRRYPAYFSLNVEVERRLRVWKHQWGLRLGFINITNHKNPNAVNNTLESPNFLHFSGGQKRAFATRIRFIGRS